MSTTEQNRSKKTWPIEYCQTTFEFRIKRLRYIESVEVYKQLAGDCILCLKL